MRVGAFEILLFFICINMSIGILNGMNILSTPAGDEAYRIEPTETTASIESTLVSNLAGSITIAIGAMFAGVLFNAVTQGAVIALILFTLNLLLPIFTWLFGGLPDLLISMGVPDIIYTPLVILVGFVWGWFLLGIVAQRYME